MSQNTRTFTRQELYDLIWSEPVQKLAGQFGLSDVGFAKACKKANIPRPPRGYWAKLAAGQKLTRQPLPARGPGMYNEIVVGGGSHGYYYGWTEDKILEATPVPPTFEDSIEEVAQRVVRLVGRVAIPKMPDRAHRLIKRLLDADEERRQKTLNSRFSFSWEGPIFANPFETRRLRVLNAIITALDLHGMKPSIHGRDARGLGASINDTHVQYTLDATTQQHDRYRGASVESRGASSKLFFQITSCRGEGIRVSWGDTDELKIEKHLDEIVAALACCRFG